MTDKATVSLECAKCGAPVSIPDNATDSAVIKCNSCGETIGTLADIKAKAAQAVADSFATPAFDKIKRIFERK